MPKSSADKIIFGAVLAVSGVGLLLFIGVFVLMQLSSSSDKSAVPPGGVEMNQAFEGELMADGGVRKALRNGDWDEAIRLQEANVRASPHDLKTREAMGYVLYRAAVGMLERADELDELNDAAVSARRAPTFLTGAPAALQSSWELYAMIGLHEYAGGAAARGRGRILEADRAAPRSPSIAYAKAYMLVNEGSYQQAQEPLRLAQSGSPAVRAEAAKLAETIRMDIKEQKDYSVTESSRFVIRYEGPDRPDVAATIMSVLTQEESRIARLVGHSPRRRIEVIVYTSNEYTARRGLPDWIGGVFDGRIRLNIGDALSDHESLRGILAHEYTHAAIYDRTRSGVPIWLNEGIAMYNEYGSLSPGSAVRVIGSAGPHLSQLNRSFVQMHAEDVNAAYYFSYAAVDWICRRYGQEKVASILGHLADGTNIDQALSKTIGHDVAGLDAAVKTDLGI